MKENIKIALLAVIALVLVVDTFFMDDSGIGRSQSLVNKKPSSSLVADNATNPNDLAPVVETNEPALPTTSMVFPETEHDFGSIQQDTENEKVFEFTNTGTEPLVIEKAKGSCGCTVPEYPKEPIQPGEKGEIRVVYKPGKQKGNQTKTVTITANTEPAQSMLYIKADVQVPEGAESAS